MVANVKVIQAEPMPEEPDAEPMMAMQTFAVGIDAEENSDEAGDNHLDADSGSLAASGAGAVQQAGMVADAVALDLLGTEEEDWHATEGAAGADGEASNDGSVPSSALDVDTDGASPSFEDDGVGLGDILDEFAADEDLTAALESALNVEGADGAGEEEGAPSDGSESPADTESGSSAAESAKVVSDEASPGGAASGGAHGASELDADAMSAQRDMVQQMIDVGKQGGDLM